MLDLVKFTWRNPHGYWIPVAWMTIPSDATDTRAEYPKTTATLREYASSGRPSMTDFAVLDRITIHEEVRLTGRTKWLLAQVILHDPNADNYTAAQFLDAMLAATA